MASNDSDAKSGDRSLLGGVKWFGALLVAIATILGAILAIRGDLPQLIGSAGGTASASATGSTNSSAGNAVTAPTNSTTQSTTGEPMGPILNQINLLGNDYNHGDLSPNAPACQERCSQDSNCKAETFEWRPNGASVCWLKNAVPPQSVNTRSFSSIKVGAQ